MALEEAETLFVACRFEEASAVCRDYLTSKPLASSTEAACNTHPRLLLGAVPVSAHECTLADLLVSVMLQCGFELRRSDEEAFCLKVYSSEMPMPSEVALLWLELRLSSGQVEGVRQDCLAFLDHLIAHQDRGKSTSVEPVDVAESPSALQTMAYSFLRLLVTQILMPSGAAEECFRAIRMCQGSLPEEQVLGLLDQVTQSKEEEGYEKGGGPVDERGQAPTAEAMQDLGSRALEFLGLEQLDPEDMLWLGGGAAAVLVALAVKYRGALARGARKVLGMGLARGSA
ncbi:unnamed protein product [Chrysoparadoxa australica]